MSYEHIQEKTVKARTKHRCIWCGETIWPGDSYVRRAYKMCGDFISENIHPECLSALRDSDEACEGFDPYQYHRGKNEVESAKIDDEVVAIVEWKK